MRAEKMAEELVSNLNRNTRKYIVVENAGYEGEQDVHTAKTYRAAVNWLRKTYDEEDREKLHPDVCLERPDGSRTYEL